MPLGIGRRKAIMALGGGVSAAFVGSRMDAAGPTCLEPNPASKEDSSFVEEQLLRSDIRTDPGTGTAQAGIELGLKITIQNQLGGVCGPLVGASVDIWQANWNGKYSDKTEDGTAGQKFLRGFQISDDNGQVAFKTVYPGWYAGRAVHINLKIRTYSATGVLGSFETQLFFDDAISDEVFAQAPYSGRGARDTRNAADAVYKASADSARNVVAVTKTATGYEVAVNVAASVETPVEGPIITDDVKNAASGAVGIAPNSWTSIYGLNLSPVTKLLDSSDIVDSAFPTKLGGVDVQINGKAAFVYFVSPTQINVLSPPDTGSGKVDVVVTNAGGASAILATLQPFLPALFVGANYVRAVRPSDSVIVNGTGASEGGYNSTAAAKAGDELELFGTGFGPAENQPAGGAVFSGAYRTTNPVTVTIGDVDAPVLYAGLVGAGVYQINIKIPAGLSAGDHPVVATVGGVKSPSSALLKTA